MINIINWSNEMNENLKSNVSDHNKEATEKK
jgi:hypothetical protein